MKEAVSSLAPNFLLWSLAFFKFFKKICKLKDKIFESTKKLLFNEQGVEKGTVPLIYWVIYICFKF